MKQPPSKSRGQRAGPGRHSRAPAEKPGRRQSVKNQIRGIERLLRKVGGDPKIRRKEEAKLEELKAVLEQHQRAERERKFAVRYHKIRFFERTKLERRLKQLERKKHAAAQGPSPWNADNEKAHTQLTRDLQYILHFPKGERYVSIIKEPEGEEERVAVHRERARLRALIDRNIANQAIVTEADEGRLLKAYNAAKPQQPTFEGTVEEAPRAEAGENDDFFLESSSGIEDSEGKGRAAAWPAAEPTFAAGAAAMSSDSEGNEQLEGAPSLVKVGAWAPRAAVSQHGGERQSRPTMGPYHKAQGGLPPTGRPVAVEPATSRPAAPKPAVSICAHQGGGNDCMQLTQRVGLPGADKIRHITHAHAAVLHRKRAEGGRKRRKKH